MTKLYLAVVTAYMAVWTLHVSGVIDRMGLLHLLFLAVCCLTGAVHAAGEPINEQETG